MNNCKDCKWWGRRDKILRNGDNKKLATCDNPDTPSFWKLHNGHGGRGGNNKVKSPWDEYGNLWTYEDFGCVNFKAP